MQTIYLNRSILLNSYNICNLKPITKGDDIKFRVQLDEDITGWTITARLYDDYFFGTEISGIVESGLDGDIFVEDLENGIFILTFSADNTESIWYKAHLEIKILDSNGFKETILNGEQNSIAVQWNQFKN